MTSGSPIIAPPCLQCGHTPMRECYRFEQFVAAVVPEDGTRQVLVRYMQAHPETAFRSIAVCGKCGVKRIHPMPVAGALDRFYADYLGDAGYSTRLDSKIRRARKRLQRLKGMLPAKATFLDVGCNLGAAVEAARQMGFTATGIEISEQSIAKAKQLFPDNRFFSTTVEQFAKHGGQFDLIFCTEVIEHVPDPLDFARALAALVKPGGLLFLTTPDAGHWRVPSDFLSWHEVKPPEHVSWQTRRGLDHLFTAVGFEKPRYKFTLKSGIRLLARRGKAR